LGRLPRSVISTVEAHKFGPIEFKIWAEDTSRSLWEGLRVEN
jgi:hypothetical protein